MHSRKYARRPAIFNNCRFDEEFLPFLQAILFTVMECGFRPRCALEQQGAETTRLQKLREIIQASPLCITDISLAPRTKADSPRLNMAFELGLFIGSMKSGAGRGTPRSLLVMDAEKYRYQRTISDLAGVDIHAHGGQPLRAIVCIREWLRSVARHSSTMPPAAFIQARFTQFLRDLRTLMRRQGYDPAQPLGLEGYLDFVEFVKVWLVENDRSFPAG